MMPVRSRIAARALVLGSLLLPSLLPAAAGAAYEELRVPGPTESSGSAGGRTDAARFGEGCVGQIGESPDHVLRVEQNGLVTLSVNSEADTSLVIVGPKVVLCDDDDGPGSNPRISEQLAAGTYQVYVGAYGEDDLHTPYSIFASDVAPAPEREVDPRQGDYGPLALPEGAVSGGQAGGRRNAAEVFGGRCRGLIDRSADHVLTVEEEVFGRIEAISEEGVVTLVVVGPGGVQCHDGARGAPYVEDVFEEGEYQIFVGARAQDDLLARYEIRAEVTQGAVEEPIQAGGALSLPGVGMANGRAGDERDAAALYGGSCSGLLDTEPNHIVTVREAGDYRLRVGARVDTTLVVVGPAGVLCDDDSAGGWDPELSGRLPEGEYRVWVGAATRREAGANYKLTVSGSAGDPGLEQPAVARELRLPGHGQVAGEAGGRTAAARVYGGSCSGYLPTEPNHTLTVDEEVEASFQLAADDPVSLVLVGPSGVICDDAEDPRRVGLTADLAPGSYRVFVGAREARTQPSYTLSALSLGDSVITQRERERARGRDDRYGDDRYGDDRYGDSRGRDGYRETRYSEREEPGGRDYRPPADRQAPPEPAGEPVPYGPLALPGPAVASGQAGGPNSAAELFGRGCGGMIESTPDHVLTVTRAGSGAIEVSSSADTTLVIEGPGGVRCNDNGADGRRNPRVEGEFEPGTYQIFVGARRRSDAMVQYTIRSEGAAGGGRGGVESGWSEAIPGADLERLESAIAGEPFSDRKLAILTSAAAEHWFEVDQVMRLLRLFSFGSDKVEAGTVLFPRTLDQENWFQVYSVFDFDSDKEILRARVGR